MNKFLLKLAGARLRKQLKAEVSNWLSERALVLPMSTVEALAITHKVTPEMIIAVETALQQAAVRSLDSLLK